MKNERFDFYVDKLRKAKIEMQKIIVGQEEMIECFLICLVINGHVWVEGPPGVGKTLGALTLANILDVDFKKIQFTPDLLPLDLKTTIDPLAKSEGPASGSETTALIDKFIKGVVFTNILLVDEGNRGPQKVQAALLEVGQERQVTVGARVYKLDRPHMIIITTNDVEHEGTYNIAEALADRMTLKAKLGYPSFEEERKIAARRKSIESGKIDVAKIFNKAEIIEMQDLFEELYQFDPESHLTDYAVRIVRHIRAEGEKPKEEALVAYGPTPRGSSDLLVSASALAMLEGTLTVTPGHIKKMALPALRGTFTLTENADREKKTHDIIINEALQKEPVLDEDGP